MNLDWHKIDNQNIWHPFDVFDTGNNILVKKAKGAYFFTDDDRKIFDGISSWWVNLHGHSHPDIVDAIATQAQNLEHIIFSGFTHQPAIDLAKSLVDLMPKNSELKKIFFSDNGSTAVEVALKLSFQYWYNKGEKRNKIIAINGAYHGDTFGAMSVGQRGLFVDPFEKNLFESYFIDFPDQENESKIINDFESLLQTNEIAAFIYEPLVQGSAGMRIYSASILQKLIDLAKKYEVICIADEVMTGFYRTGKIFASDYLQSPPDIMCLSKGITGGFMPLGVTVVSNHIYKIFDSKEIDKKFLHGHSYTGNPLSCAAANASMKLLLDPLCQQSVNRISISHQKFVQKLKLNSKIKNANSLGTILRLEIISSEKTSYQNSLREQMYQYFLNKNILLRPLGNIIYIIPPYCSSEEDIIAVYSAIENGLENNFQI